MFEKRRRSFAWSLALLTLVFGGPAVAGQENAGAETGRLINAELATELVPGPAKYDVLLPPGYDKIEEPLPLLLWLHGGSSGVDHLERRIRARIERAWAEGAFSPAVVVAPITGNSYYIDWKDGSHYWETFILKELLPHIRKTYNVRQDREGTVVAGASAGGQGTLRIALRNPETFIGAAAMEPGFPPVMSFDELDITPYGPDAAEFLKTHFGDPVDKDYWHACHPPTIVVANADRIRKSQIQLRIEAGDEDANGTYLGAELVHRLLFDAAIPHDYHLERGAAHTGRSMPRRLLETFAFLERALHPQGPDPDAERHLQGAKKKGRYSPRTVNQLPFALVKFAPLQQAPDS